MGQKFKKLKQVINFFQVIGLKQVIGQVAYIFSLQTFRVLCCFR